MTRHGAAIDTTTAAGKLVFGIFAAFAEFERELISERTRARLASARARGRKGGRPFKMTTAQTAPCDGGDGEARDLGWRFMQRAGHHAADTIPTYFAQRPDGKKLLNQFLSYHRR